MSLEFSENRIVYLLSLILVQRMEIIFVFISFMQILCMGDHAQYNYENE